jgi:phosphatidate cytidylyltransferase
VTGHAPPAAQRDRRAPLNAAASTGMLRVRVVTALVLVAGFLAALFTLPPAGWTLVAALILAAAAWEWAGFAERRRPARAVYAILTCAAALAIAAGAGLLRGQPGALSLAPVYATAAAFWLLFAPWWLARQPRRLGAAPLLAAGWVVLIPTFLALVHLRNIHPGSLLAFMSIVWIADVAAYFVGRRFGRTKLAVAISPGKTREGFYGALAAAAVYALAWMLLFPGHAPALLRDLPGSVVWMLLLVVALAALSVVGDLLESAMKRQAGLKDSGALLPGHGGILDRIDALTPVLPLAALVSMA